MINATSRSKPVPAPITVAKRGVSAVPAAVPGASAPRALEFVEGPVMGDGADVDIKDGVVLCGEEETGSPVGASVTVLW